MWCRRGQNVHATPILRSTAVHACKIDKSPKPENRGRSLKVVSVSKLRTSRYRRTWEWYSSRMNYFNPRTFLTWLAKRRLLRMPGTKISSTAKVNYRGIGGKSFSSLDIGSGSIFEGRITFDREGASVWVGKNTFIGSSSIICAERVEIGDDVLISWGCSIVDHNSHAISWNDRCDDVRNWHAGEKTWEKVIRRKIVIGNRAWVGFNSIILKGVSIGEGAVVGAGSVVTKDVRPYTVVAGNPARIVKEIAHE